MEQLIYDCVLKFNGSGYEYLVFNGSFIRDLSWISSTSFGVVNEKSPLLHTYVKILAQWQERSLLLLITKFSVKYKVNNIVVLIDL